MDIAQEKIARGECEEGIKIYTDNLPGFTREYAICVLKNLMAITTAEDKISVVLTDNKDVLEENADNLYNWNHVIKGCYSDMELQMSGLKDSFNHLTDLSICPFAFDLTGYAKVFYGTDPDTGEEMSAKVGKQNLCAHVLSGYGWSGQYGDGSRVWDNLCNRVELVPSETNEADKVYYYITRYVSQIRNLREAYMRFVKLNKFLKETELADHKFQYLEEFIEGILYRLTQFAKSEKGYNHPMCDKQIKTLKESILTDIGTTGWGKEYLERGILRKNILDGYDAGWLAPNGDFYGKNGPTSALLHVLIAEELYRGFLHDEVGDNNQDTDAWLEEHGWMKTHHNEATGHFYRQSPTKQQIEAIYEYANRYYNGKIFTIPSVVRNIDDKPVKVSDLRQMDEIALRTAFR